ncbi:hypothetical protein ACQPT2_17680 [Erwinia amylovora]
MLFHDDELGHTIIGEAALSLALGGKDINVEALIAELNLLAECETCETRLSQISDARSWLKSFNQPGKRNSLSGQWMMSEGHNSNVEHSGDVIRFRLKNDNET